MKNSHKFDKIIILITVLSIPISIITVVFVAPLHAPLHFLTEIIGFGFILFVLISFAFLGTVTSVIYISQIVCLIFWDFILHFHDAVANYKKNGFFKFWKRYHEKIDFDEIW